jgi:membrane protease YdiL (CAAX protease family)
MAAQRRLGSRWATLPVSVRAIITGVFVAFIAANVWPALLLSLGVPLAATVELVFLGLYVWWAGGGGPPQRTHAAIVLLFRFTPYPTEAFRHRYDLSFIPSQALRWIAVVVSAISAGICEETGFRGYMQQPIEERHGAPTAILLSSFLFMLLHLTKAWAMVGMVPIVLGAGVLLGLLAWSARSLIPGIVGHVAMDIGLFAYWWTGIAGDFVARPISETGTDRPFLMTCAVLAVSLPIMLSSVRQLRRSGAPTAVAV